MSQIAEFAGQLFTSSLFTDFAYCAAAGGASWKILLGTALCAFAPGFACGCCSLLAAGGASIFCLNVRSPFARSHPWSRHRSRVSRGARAVPPETASSEDDSGSDEVHHGRVDGGPRRRRGHILDSDAERGHLHRAVVCSAP